MKRFSSRLALLQWIDRRLGAPVAAALTAARRIAGNRPGSAAATPRKILFVKLAEQGSTVLACDAIRQAATRVGRENVHFLVFEENRFILDLLELVPKENVFAVRTESVGASLSSVWRQLRTIRRRGIDTTIDLEFFARSTAILSFLTGARTRVGFHCYFGEGPYRGDLFTHRVLYNPHLHTSATFVSLVQALDVPRATLPTQPVVPVASAGPVMFHPGSSETDRVRELLRQRDVPAGSRLVLLNANCGDMLPQRKWSGENYVALAARLLRNFPEVVVVFTGSAAEAARVDALAAEVSEPRCISLAGETTLRELLVLYTLAEVLVTNDSGPAHFAALTEIDVVALFGPETPLLFGVNSPRSHSLWAKLPCSPCVNAYNNRQTACRDNRCMQALTIDLVHATTAAVLARRLARRSDPVAALNRG